MQQATTVSLQLGFLRPPEGNPISPNLIEIKEERVEGLGGFACPECQSKGTDLTEILPHWGWVIFRSFL